MSRTRFRLRVCAAVTLLACAITCNAGAASTIVTGTDAGATAHVKSFDGLTASEQASFLPYGTATFGVRVAASDVTGDGRADFAVAPGTGAASNVKVYDGQTLGLVHSFLAYDPLFTGGVYVAAGDVNGDRRADVITASGTGSPGHVKVFDGVTLAERASFFAFSPLFTGGARVAAGDVNGDGRSDLVVGTGPGGGQIRVFDASTLAELHSFLPFGAYAGGLFVAAGDLNGDGRADLIAGTEAGVAGQVTAFDGQTLTPIRSFFPFGPLYTGGVRVGAGDVNGDGSADILVAAGPGSAPEISEFDGSTGALIRSFFAYDVLDTSGVFVAGETPIVPEPAPLALAAASLLPVLLGRRRPCVR